MRSRKLETHLRKVIEKELKRIYNHPKYRITNCYGDMYVETFRKNGKVLNEAHQIVQVTVW